MALALLSLAACDECGSRGCSSAISAQRPTRFYDASVMPDAGEVLYDGGMPDVGFIDAGFIDAGFIDAGALDANPVDVGPPDAGNLSQCVLLCLATEIYPEICNGDLVCCEGYCNS